MISKHMLHTSHIITQIIIVIMNHALRFQNTWCIDAHTVENVPFFNQLVILSPKIILIVFF